MLDEEIGDLMIEELVAQVEEARRRIKGYQNLYFAQQERIEELEGISSYKTREHQDTCDELHKAEDRIEELEAEHKHYKAALIFIARNTSGVAAAKALATLENK